MTDPASSAISALTTALYADVKVALVAVLSKFRNLYSRATQKHYESPGDLDRALLSGEIEDGEWIVVQCKPAPFGPFFRTHFVSPFIGSHTRMRLGPPLSHPNPIMGLFTQTTSYLTPVGLYPSLDEDAIQVSLYPPNTTASGFVGLVPGINELVPRMSALFAPRFARHFGNPIRLTGVMRTIDLAAMAQSGFRPEDYEVLRQTGRIWFLDATDEDADCKSIGDGESQELWGGLYASGHLEIGEGDLPIDAVLIAIEEGMKAAGFEPEFNPNLAGNQELTLNAVGCRASLTRDGLYSIHMDAELAQSFANSRAKFDTVVEHTLHGLRETVQAASVQLTNELDVDFSYTDSTKAYSVLKSQAADEIQDPLAMAIRDWHRRRGA